MEVSAVRLEAAAAKFYDEFATLERVSLEKAILSLSDDEIFVRKTGELLDFDARLILLRRLALSRRIPTELSSELESTLRSAKQLFGSRNTLRQAVLPGESYSTAALSAQDGRLHRRRLDKVVTHSEAGRARSIHAHSIPLIDSYAEQARQLQLAMRKLAARLDAHRRDAQNTNIIK